MTGQTTGQTKPITTKGLLRVLATAMAVASFGVAAFGVNAASAADAHGLGVELNKLEPYEKGCRAYMVITNSAETGYQTVKLDLVLFQPDGVIARRFAVDLAPLKASKKSVKLFDIDALACEKIASVLVNDVIECKSDAGAVPDCLAKMTLTSVAGPPLTK